MVKHITEYRNFPVNVNCGEINAPDNYVLPISGNARAKVDIQSLGLASERIARDVINDPWYERALIITIRWPRRPSACGVRCRRTSVAEDTSTEVIVAAITSSLGLGAEPIIPNRLVRVDNYIVALT